MKTRRGSSNADHVQVRRGAKARKRFAFVGASRSDSAFARTGQRLRELQSSHLPGVSHKHVSTACDMITSSGAVPPSVESNESTSNGQHAKRASACSGQHAFLPARVSRPRLDA